MEVRSGMTLVVVYHYVVGDTVWGSEALPCIGSDSRQLEEHSGSDLVLNTGGTAVR